MRTRFYGILFICLFLGCASVTSTGSGGEEIAAAEPDVESFELIGSWEYVGGFPGLTNYLMISEEQMSDWGDYYGTDWNILFSVESWDNDTSQLLLKVAEIEGFSHYGLGESLYLSWHLEEDVLTLYIDTTGFLEPRGGTEGDAFVTYSRQ